MRNRPTPPFRDFVLSSQPGVRSREQKLLALASVCLIALILTQITTHIQPIRTALDAAGAGFVANTAVSGGEASDITLYLSPLSAHRNVSIMVNGRWAADFRGSYLVRTTVRNGDEITIVNRTEYLVMVTYEPGNLPLAAPLPGSTVFVPAHRSSAFPNVHLALQYVVD